MEPVTRAARALAPSAAGVTALALVGSLAGCADPGPPWTGNDESILGYLLTFLAVAAVGATVALGLLLATLFLLAASGALVFWNLVRPHPIGRALAVGFAVLDTFAGSALLVGLLWLSVDTDGGAVHVDLRGGGLVGLLAVALLLLAPATFLSALTPRRPPPDEPATDEPPAPST